MRQSEWIRSGREMSLLSSRMDPIVLGDGPPVSASASGTEVFWFSGDQKQAQWMLLDWGLLDLGHSSALPISNFDLTSVFEGTMFPAGRTAQAPKGQQGVLQ